MRFKRNQEVEEISSGKILLRHIHNSSSHFQLEGKKISIVLTRKSGQTDRQTAEISNSFLKADWLRTE